MQFGTHEVKKWEPDISEEKYVQTSDSLIIGQLLQKTDDQDGHGRTPIFAMPAMNEDRVDGALLFDKLQCSSRP